MSAPRDTAAPTAGAAVADAARRLAAAGVARSRLDARLLVAGALGVDAAAVVGYPETPVEPAAHARLAGLVARRAAREPVSRIFGRREFWGLPFRVTAATLDPRPDSEAVVLAALDAVRDRLGGGRPPLAILDLGTGTGCLLLALLHEWPDAMGVGVDRSPAAVAVARANAAALGLADRASFAVADWGRGLGRKFDCIVANPPYIRDSEIAHLAPEVARFEPMAALSGGADGLDRYREMAPSLARLLAPEGVASVEIGAGQAGGVAGIFGRFGLETAVARRDLAGRERCVNATLSKVTTQ